MRRFQIAFKIDGPEAAKHGVDECSDHLEIEFETAAEARDKIAAIRADASRVGYMDWLQDAILWVQDTDGNLI